MKRLLFAAAAILLMTAVSFAASPVDELYEQFGVDRLEEAVPPQAREMAETVFSDGFSVSELLTLSPSQLAEAVKAEAKRAAAQYRGELASVMTAVLLCAILSAAGESGSQNDVFGIICTLSITAVLLRPALGCLQEGCGTLRDISRFMLAYIPVYSSVIATSGAAASAAAYQTAVMAASQVMSQLANSLFMPLMQSFLLLSLSGAIGRSKGVSSLAAGVKKITNWGLALTATAFTGLLSLQSIISSAADGAAAKTVKFLTGSFVPIIGGAFSDALSVMQGSLRIIRATVGGLGIAAVALAFLPALINITMLRMVIWAAKTAGETLSAGEAARVLSGFADMLSTMTALLLCVMMTLIISTAIMINAAAGAV